MLTAMSHCPTGRNRPPVGDFRQVIRGICSRDRISGVSTTSPVRRPSRIIIVENFCTTISPGPSVLPKVGGNTSK